MDSDDQTKRRHPVRIFTFGASLRGGSLNARLAALAAEVVRLKGGEADISYMAEFDCSSYDQDVEQETGIPDGAIRLRTRLLAADARD